MSEFERGVAEPSPRARLVRCTVILSTLTALYVTAVGSLSHGGAAGRMHRSSSTASISMNALDHSRSQCAYDAELSTISRSSEDRARRSEGQVSPAALDIVSLDR
jgi:hypothetical protein